MHQSQNPCFQSGIISEQISVNCEEYAQLYQNRKIKDINLSFQQSIWRKWRRSKGKENSIMEGQKERRTAHRGWEIERKEKRIRKKEKVIIERKNITISDGQIRLWYRRVGQLKRGIWRLLWLMFISLFGRIIIIIFDCDKSQTRWFQLHLVED